MFLFELLSQTLNGKSLTRGLLNLKIKSLSLSLSGDIVDLGSGLKRPSYFKFVRVLDGAKVISIDVDSKKQPTIVADISDKIPLKNNFADFIFLLNIMYLISSPEKLLVECKRILKTTGKALVNFPLVFPITNEPKDYWRYTDNAVKMLIKNSDLKIEKMIFYGDRVSSAESLIDNYFPPFLRLFIHPLILLGDFIFTKITYNSFLCPIGILVLARKLTKNKKDNMPRKTNKNFV